MLDSHSQFWQGKMIDELFEGNLVGELMLFAVERDGYGVHTLIFSLRTLISNFRFEISNLKFEI